mmetsp:Transcript_104956/g.273134  ORF Transcript_104956/g.273134 Transcript_104956/m.273134 type:complete len:441 (+) Transcript_104956:45-1367(+)
MACDLADETVLGGLPAVAVAANEALRSASAKVNMDDVASHNSRQDCWVVLYGEAFDVTEYVQHHPGKDFLLQAAGKDASGLFESIHGSKGKAVLKSEGFRSRYLVGKVDRPEPEEFTFANDVVYQEMSAEVEAYFKSVAGTMWAKGGLCERAVVYVKFVLILGLALFTKYQSVLGSGSLVNSFMHCITMLLVIFNISHGACHGELIMRYPTWFSKLSQWVHVFLGSRPGDWMQWHNVSHHQHTNTHSDLDTNRGMPFLRLHDEDPHFWWLRYQHRYVWFIYPMTHIVTFIQRERFFAAFQISLCNLLSWALAGRFCMWQLLAESFMFGFGFVMINHITHTNDETEYVHRPSTKVGWGEHQLRSSSNWCMDNIAVTMLLGGINYQIEHHLFQSIHHIHYPEMSKIIRRVSKKQNVPYVSFPTYFAALRSHIKLLVRMGTPL